MVRLESAEVERVRYDAVRSTERRMRILCQVCFESDVRTRFSMAFELRPIVEHDLPDLIEFWSRTPGIGLNESDTPECLKIFLDRNPGLSLIALAGDRIAGALLSGHDGRRGSLHHLAVAEPFRRQGLGRELVERCLSKLREEGILKCNIFLYADNDAGREFWTRCGWSRRIDLVMMQHPCRTSSR
jgi:putative acetyltransferase